MNALSQSGSAAASFSNKDRKLTISTSYDRVKSDVTSNSSKTNLTSKMSILRRFSPARVRLTDSTQST